MIKVIPVVTPACNTISVNPTSGNIPLSSSVTCNTTSATTIQIDCGNGQSFPNTSATCTYTTVGTFTPKCTVDGTLSPASCQGSVTTTSVPVQPVCGPNTGVQVSPVTASTSGICPTGTSVVGFTPSGISPILYTWNCKDNITNLTSPSCNASYTPPIVPTCNSISVTPTGGTIPLTTNISCNTSNATTTNIICGNGQAFAGPTANCTYTTVGTFSPQCKVNATITSPACQ